MHRRLAVGGIGLLLSLVGAGCMTGGGMRPLFTSLSDPGGSGPGMKPLLAARDPNEGPAGMRMGLRPLMAERDPNDPGVPGMRPLLARRDGTMPQGPAEAARPAPKPQVAGSAPGEPARNGMKPLFGGPGPSQANNVGMRPLLGRGPIQQASMQAAIPPPAPLPNPNTGANRMPVRPAPLPSGMPSASPPAMPPAMPAPPGEDSTPVTMDAPSLREAPVPEQMLPTEKLKVSYPEYVIEIPDILLIDVIRAVPRGPYKVQPLDALIVNCKEALREEPIQGLYAVGPDGRVNLGLNYGAVLVVDLSIEEAQEAIRKHLAGIVTSPKVIVSIAQTGGVQQVRGEHLVRPDGTVGLGKYGSVRVIGLTLDEAKSAIEAHLSQELVKPEVSIDVYSYNSKFYYVIFDGAGYGEQIYRLPATGNETVLDALSQINGLPPVASKGRIWVARPAPPRSGCRDQILPVNYCGITQGGQTSTNYQLLPGDRVYVKASPLITGTTWLARALEPVERLFGVTLLGASTIRTIDGSGGFGGGGVAR